MWAQSVADFPSEFWGSFSAGSLVIWAPQVAGGDEPPSVLSDNLPRSGWSSQTFWSWFPAKAPRRMHCPRVLTCDRALKGHKLISQTVALSRGLPLRWKAARFRFVIKCAGAERQGEGLRGHPMCLLRSRVRSPSSAGRALCRERPGRKRRWRNQRISLASGQERVPG